MAILKRHKNSIYLLNDSLTTLSDNITTQATTRSTNIGDLTTIDGGGAASVVEAINTVSGSLGGVSDATLKIANNLSDVDDPAVARQNLDVYEQNDFLDQLELGKLAIGTNYTVADIAARDALTDIDGHDRVLVQDDGTGGWALYKPDQIDAATGAIGDWLLITSKTILSNIVTDEALRTYYLSNADTNAFTDSEQTKVGFLSVTKAIDLGDVALAAELSNDITDATGVDLLASVDAIKAYADGVASISGYVTTNETVVVNGDQIVLSHAPINGVNGVANFGNARYTDANSVSYDAPLQATADPKTFTVLTETDSAWDGNSVMVNYFYFGEPGVVEGNQPVSDGSGLTGGDDVESPTVDDDGFADQGTLPEP